MQQPQTHIKGSPCTSWTIVRARLSESVYYDTHNLSHTHVITIQRQTNKTNKQKPLTFSQENAIEKIPENFRLDLRGAWFVSQGLNFLEQ